MATYADRMKEAMEKRNMRQADIAEKTGIARGTLSSYLSGKYEPKQEKLYMIAKALNVSEAWLMGADVPMARIKRSSDTAIRIPVYRKIPAGIPIEAIEDVIDFEEISADMIKGGSEYIAIKVCGNSMYPKYLDGDVVIVKLQPDCENGQDAVVYVNGYEATLKKVLKKKDHIVLQPLNPDFEPGIYMYKDTSNPVKILGVVKEIRRKV